MRRKRKPEQGTLLLFRHGGARKGAGRKPKGEKAGVPHATRERFAARHPVLVTSKVMRGIWSLRGRRLSTRLWEIIAKANARGGMRIVHFSIQRNHLHLLVEAEDAELLARGMQGLSVRIARMVNRVMGRKGTVFADRYHSRALTTPRAVRNAIAYVLGNARRHGVAAADPTWVDPLSSGYFFDGWTRAVRTTPTMLPSRASPAERAETWLLSVGWRRAGGRIDPGRRPGPAARRAA